MNCFGGGRGGSGTAGVGVPGSGCAVPGCVPGEAVEGPGPVADGDSGRLEWKSEHAESRLAAASSEMSDEKRMAG